MPELHRIFVRKKGQQILSSAAMFRIKIKIANVRGNGLNLHR